MSVSKDQEVCLVSLRSICVLLNLLKTRLERGFDYYTEKYRTASPAQAECKDVGVEATSARFGNGCKKVGEPNRRNEQANHRGESQ